jgi:hypothetical protein
MLPLLKKESMKCIECNTTAHKECSLLVPNHCGLSPSLVAQMLSAIEDAEQMKKMKMRTPFLTADDKKLSIMASPSPQRRATNNNNLDGAEQSSDTPMLLGGNFFVLNPEELSNYDDNASGRSSMVPSHISGGDAPTKIFGSPVPSESLMSPTSPQHRVSPMIVTDDFDKLVQSAKAKSKRKLGLDDFTFISVLGKGNFGKVCKSVSS